MILPQRPAPEQDQVKVRVVVVGVVAAAAAAVAAAAVGSEALAGHAESAVVFAMGEAWIVEGQRTDVTADDDSSLPFARC